MGKYKYTKQHNQLSNKDYFFIEVPNEEIILKFNDTSKMKESEVDNLVDIETDKFLANREAMKQKEIEEREAKILELQNELALLQGEG